MKVGVAKIKEVVVKTVKMVDSCGGKWIILVWKSSVEDELAWS